MCVNQEDDIQDEPAPGCARGRRADGENEKNPPLELNDEVDDEM